MVAKGFMAAAAIIICCATTLRGNDQETKCSGDCPTACCDKEKCSVEHTACADGKCDDQEECCEQEQVSLEKCSTEKCSTGKCATSKCSAEKCTAEQCSTEKCSTETCSTGECAKSKCAKSKCSAEKCAKETCSTEKCSTDKCSAEKCTAGTCGGEKCAFTTTLGGLCGPLKCAWEATPVSIGVSVETCSKSACSAESCAIDQSAASMKANVACNAGACEGESCPVAVCATQVCEALKCAVQSCTTASDDDRCQDEICAAGTCGTTQCATLQCSGQDSPPGQCNGAPIKVAGRSGQKCGVNARLTATGGELTFTMAEWFPGTPVAEKCSTEVCTEGTCSTAKCEAGKCATEIATTKTCASGKCAKSTSLEVAAKPTTPVTACAKQADCASASARREITAAIARLEAKIAAVERLQAKIGAHQAADEPAQMYVVDVKVVEVNKSRCRSLGWDLEVAGGNAACEFVGQTLEDLTKRNLVKILFNPTLCVMCDRPASFRAGAEITPKIAEGKGTSGFVGKTVEVLASPAGENKVHLHIAPSISQLDFAMQDLPQIKSIKWDFDCEATLGKPMVLKGAGEQRVIAKTVVGRGTIEDIEEVETMLIVTVNTLDKVDRQAEVKQTTYEEGLVDAVKAPEFLTKVYPVPDLQVWKVRPQGVQFDADLLIAHIKSTIDAQSWRGFVYADPQQAERANGAIQPFERNGSLVICQTEENHQQIANLLTKMRADGQQKDAAREERELLDGDVTPASAEAPVEQEAKCTKGACSESKCNGSKCSKSDVSMTTAPAAECTGNCQGESPETASCPCIGGTCTR